MTRGEDSIVPQLTWRIKDRLYRPAPAMVMGILNATPDSFHSESRVSADDIKRKADAMIGDGAAILDVGGASSRPGAQEIAEQEELDRILRMIGILHDHHPDMILSVDTYRAKVAEEAVKAGAGMVNDIGAGLLDPKMLATVAKLNVPYVIMHMQGTPRNMQQDPKYTDVVKEVVLFLSQRLNAARAAGIADVIVDPGFGFGKTTGHNLMLLKHLPALAALGVPVLAGLSRKRMINEILGTTPNEALNGTTVLNAIALQNGARILRVHDVKEAVQCVELLGRLNSAIGSRNAK